MYSCVFSSGVRRGLGHLLFLTTRKTPNPVTYCRSCVDRGVWQLKPSNPTTPAGAVWCNPIQSHPAPSCPAFSLLKGLFRRGLRRSPHKLQLISLCLFKCSAGFLGNCFSLDYQKFSVHVETLHKLNSKLKNTYLCTLLNEQKMLKSWLCVLEVGREMSGPCIVFLTGWPLRNSPAKVINDWSLVLSSIKGVKSSEHWELCC